jgi:hypothetical protein
MKTSNNLRFDIRLECRCKSQVIIALVNYYFGYHILMAIKQQL